MNAPFDQHVTFLYAEDPAPSWRFYEEVLGLPLAQDQGSCRIYAAASGGRGLNIGKIYSQSGMLVATVVQEGLIRYRS